MSEQAKKKTNIEKRQDFVQQIAQCSHDLGVNIHNIELAKDKVLALHLKIKNLTIDANNLHELIEKEIAEETIAKAKTEKETIKPALELVTEIQAGGDNVLQ